jgi:hypothetical protein
VGLVHQQGPVKNGKKSNHSSEARADVAQQVCPSQLLLFCDVTPVLMSAPKEFCVELLPNTPPNAMMKPLPWFESATFSVTTQLSHCMPAP